MQMAGSSMRDIVAQDLQEIPRVLATIRSVMCVLRARLILEKGIAKILVCTPALALITSVMAGKNGTCWAKHSWGTRWAKIA
jgi:hypothetical protein